MFQKIVFAIGLVLVGMCANAQTQPPQSQYQYQPYFVSGVLKANDSTMIKVVQGMVVSDSADNARIVFTGLASKQFPGYFMLDSIAGSFSQLYKTLPSAFTEPGTVKQAHSEGV